MQNTNLDDVNMEVYDAPNQYNTAGTDIPTEWREQEQKKTATTKRFKTTSILIILLIGNFVFIALMIALLGYQTSDRKCASSDQDKDSTELRDAIAQLQKDIAERMDMIEMKFSEGILRLEQNISDNSSWNNHIVNESLWETQKQCSVNGAKFQEILQEMNTTENGDRLLTQMHNLQQDVETTQHNLQRDVCAVSSRDSLPFVCRDFEEGGWIVIQRRLYFDVDFQRSYAEYQQGFRGSQDWGDFWLGLEKIHQLTSNSSTWVMQSHFESWNDNKAYWIEHTGFSVGGSSTKYQLTVGSRIDGSFDEDLGWSYLNGMKFTAYDADNDLFNSGNCATDKHSGGWWYSGCSTFTFNGLRSTGVDSIDDNWKHMKYYINGIAHRALKNSVVRIKPL